MGAMGVEKNQRLWRGKAADGSTGSASSIRERRSPEGSSGANFRPVAPRPRPGTAGCSIFRLTSSVVLARNVGGMTGAAGGRIEGRKGCERATAFSTVPTQCL